MAHFADDAVVQWIREELGTTVETTLYDDLYAILLADLRGRLRGRAQTEQDGEDIVQEVIMRVFLHIEEYAEATALPAQRNAWLNRILSRVIYDFYRTKTLIRTPRDQEPMTTVHEPAGWSDNRQDDFWQTVMDEALGSDGVERGYEQRQAVAEAIEAILALNSKPEKLLVFLLAAFTKAEDAAGGSGGFYANLRLALEGRSFFQLRYEVGFRVRPYALSPTAFDKVDKRLNRKLSKGLYGDRIFEANAHLITAWVSELRGQIHPKT